MREGRFCRPVPWAAPQAVPPKKRAGPRSIGAPQQLPPTTARPPAQAQSFSPTHIQTSRARLPLLPTSRRPQLSRLRRPQSILPREPRRRRPLSSSMASSLTAAACRATARLAGSSSSRRTAVAATSRGMSSLSLSAKDIYRPPVEGVYNGALCLLIDACGNVKVSALPRAASPRTTSSCPPSRPP